MASLDEHMRELGDHARLGYRADCAVCRLERGNRHLPESKLRSMRAQATAFALLLGASGLAAGPARADDLAAGPAPGAPGEETADAGATVDPGATVEVPVPPPEEPGFRYLDRGVSDRAGSTVGTSPAPPPTQNQAAIASPPTSAPPPAVTDSGARHVVRRGDTLRLIAERLLGPGASDAQLASAVERLWDLNARRIASGDPGDLAPGEVLALPGRR